MQKTSNTPIWRTIGVYLIDSILLPLLATLILYALWYVLGLPEIRYIWLILVILLSYLMNNEAREKWGNTPGRMIFRCDPTTEETNKVGWSILWILAIVVIAIKF